jgi:TPR repeat protein
MRQKLLEIARQLISRHGEDAVTLSAVANEADIAHATIYGYFSSKREMLTALASLPAAPAITEPVSPPAIATTGPERSSVRTADSAPESQPVPRAAAAVEAAATAPAPTVFETSEDVVWDDAEMPAEVSALHHDDGDEIPAVEEFDVASSHGASLQAFETGAFPGHDTEALEHGPGEKAPAVTEEAGGALPDPLAQHDGAQVEHAAGGNPPSLDARVQHSARELPNESAFDPILPNFEKRRAQAAQLDAIARHLVLPEGGGRDGTDALINRLENRLRVIESSITGLETRHNALEARSGSQVKPVSEQIEQLLKRSEEFEARHMRTLSELRLEIHELGSRLISADSPHQDAMTEEPAWSLPVHEPESIEPPVVAPEEPAEEPEATLEPEGPEAEESRHAYLSAVRSLAKEGARQAAERESVEEAEKQIRRRKVYVAAGVAAACLGAVVLLFRFHPGSHGVSIAQSRVSPSAAAFAPRSPLHVATAPAPLGPLDLLTARANKGDPRAELVIGLKYLSGDGVPADDVQAARWLARAANKGNAVAQNHLGALYQSGRGVTRDNAQAKRWYEAAATQGDRHAMSNLAVLYAGGESRDFSAAARWFQRSASLGYVDAQFNLAVLFERGDGVPQSLLDAYRWYSIAARAGDAVAKTRAAAIATQISPEELQAAQRAAALFQPQALNHAANDVPTMQDVLASR